VSKAVLSIGSNLGDRLGRLAAVLDALGPDLVAVSPVYETAPWGPVAQDDFLNAIVLASHAGRDAKGWLELAHRTEQAEGREREVHWGPRTLDVDVIQVTSDAGEIVSSDDPVLTLPHPRAQERGFVLVPWLAVEPDAALLGHGSVRELVAALPDDERSGVRPRDDLSLER
jgi:2-amino-4-hydroxy-6-hydroxymethyldihydropteridine diphosphokinase